MKKINKNKIDPWLWCVKIYIKQREVKSKTI